MELCRRSQSAVQALAVTRREVIAGRTLKLYQREVSLFLAHAVLTYLKLSLSLTSILLNIATFSFRRESLSLGAARQYLDDARATLISLRLSPSSSSLLLHFRLFFLHFVTSLRK